MGKHRAGRHRAAEDPRRLPLLVTALALGGLAAAVGTGVSVAPVIQSTPQGSELVVTSPSVTPPSDEQVVRYLQGVRASRSERSAEQAAAAQTQQAVESQAVAEAEAEIAQQAEEAALAEAEAVEEEVAPEVVEEEVAPEPPAAPAGVAVISNSAGPVSARAQAAADAVVTNVPGAAGITIGGTRSSAVDPGGHPSGNALDYMVMSDTALGDAIVAYHIANWSELGVDYIIWQQQYLSSPDGAWQWMEDRGSTTANHYDHPHVNYLP